MTKEEAEKLTNEIEELIGAVIDCREANDGEFGDGGRSAHYVKICKERLAKLLAKDCSMTKEEKAESHAIAIERFMSAICERESAQRCESHIAYFAEQDFKKERKVFVEQMKKLF